MNNNVLRNGALLMTLAGIAFVGYGLLFLVLSFVGSGFELGVDTLGGLTKEALGTYNSALSVYVTHLHVALSGFIIATGFATAIMSWYGVRAMNWWAFVGAVLTPVIALIIALPLHYTGGFEMGPAHLWPIYAAVVIFVIGVVMAYRGMTQTRAA